MESLRQAAEAQKKQREVQEGERAARISEEVRELLVKNFGAPGIEVPVVITDYEVLGEAVAVGFAEIDGIEVAWSFNHGIFPGLGVQAWNGYGRSLVTTATSLIEVTERAAHAPTRIPPEELLDALNDPTEVNARDVIAHVAAVVRDLPRLVDPFSLRRRGLKQVMPGPRQYLHVEEQLLTAWWSEAGQELQQRVVAVPVTII